MNCIAKAIAAAFSSSPGRYNPLVHRVPTAASLATRTGIRLSARVAILAATFLIDKIILNSFVDFNRSQNAQDFGAFVRESQHWGFRFLVAMAAAVVIFAFVRGGERLQSAAAAMRPAPVRVGWVLAHILMVVCLMPLSFLLYRDGVSPLPFGMVVTLWITLACGAALSAVLAMAPWPLWLSAARSLGLIWAYATIAAVLGSSAMQLSQKLWDPTAALTFDLVRRLLSPVIPTLNADAATRILSTEHFAVQISEICSGLEGLGLILAFSIAWLAYFRREYIFPRALLLIPVGLLAIFSLNILRIAGLMLIGDAGFKDVAEYGFHSQAGWIAFNAVACGLIFFSRRSGWLSHVAAQPAAQVPTDNPTAAYLVPLLAILAAGVLSHAMSGRFESLYPLRLIAGFGALCFYRRQLRTLDWRWSWWGPAAGLCVFLLWLFGAHYVLPAAAIPQQLAAMAPGPRGLWIVSRIGASVLIVPIAEELAYRGYLMRRLSQANFEAVPFQSVRWPALAATAIIFGLAHGRLWLPGLVAGLVYGLVVVRRGKIGEAVVAHATSNALIAASVLRWNQWQLW